MLSARRAGQEHACSTAALATTTDEARRIFRNRHVLCDQVVDCFGHADYDYRCGDGVTRERFDRVCNGATGSLFQAIELIKYDEG